MKDLQTITESLAEKGLTQDQEVICYCTGGVRSAWLYFVLKLAGYRKVRNYPGSWWEWSRDFACPVEKDAKGLQHILNVDPQAAVPVLGYRTFHGISIGGKNIFFSNQK